MTGVNSGLEYCRKIPPHLPLRHLIGDVVHAIFALKIIWHENTFCNSYYDDLTEYR
jgi:hypothetical protein